MPRMIPGVTPWNGKKNPVTEVATVVARKSIVQPHIRFEVNSPQRTTRPDRIPIRLMTTCTMVNVSMTGIITPRFWRCRERSRYRLLHARETQRALVLPTVARCAVLSHACERHPLQREDFNSAASLPFQRRREDFHIAMRDSYELIFDENSFRT